MIRVCLCRKRMGEQVSNSEIPPRAEMQLNMAKQQRSMAIQQQAASMQSQATQYKLQMEMQQKMATLYSGAGKAGTVGAKSGTSDMYK